MKIQTPENRFTRIAGGFLLGGMLLTGPAMGQGLVEYLATFDTDIAAHTGTGGGVAGNTTAAWSSQDVDGSATSGSMSVTINWPDNGTGWQEVQLNFDTAWPGLDSAAWLNVECDIKIDRAGSNLGPNGNFGFARLICQSWSGTGWGELGTNLQLKDTDDWQHLSGTLAGFVGNVNRVVIRLGSNGSNNVTNTVKYLIDNIKFTAPPLPPPTLAAPQPGTPGGLTLIPGTSSEWQRVQVHPLIDPPGPGSDFGWYNRGGPVNYSFTVREFPNVNDFSIQCFFVPVAHMRDGNAQSTFIDWSVTNYLRLVVGAGTNNPPISWNVEVAAKTNAPDANPNTTLLSFNYDKLPTGQWTLRMNNNTDFTVICPDGFTTNGTMSTEIADLVSGWDQFNTLMVPYFGIMPRTTAHIGEPTVFSRIAIDGVTFPIEDDFTGTQLDTNKWTKIADYQPGIFVTGEGVDRYISWNTPNDQGFSTLVGAADVNGPWKEIGAEADEWLLINGVRKARIYNSALTAALGPEAETAAYFQLLKREFTKLQILLPGETAAPGTPTGKTGTPTPIPANSPANIVVNAVDDDWYLVPSVSHALTLSSTDTLLSPTAGNLALGTATIEVWFGTTGSHTVTVEDATDATKGSDTSSPVTITP